MNRNGLTCGADRDHTLWRRASKVFGSWNNALSKIGLDPEKIKRDARRRAARKHALEHCRYPDEESALKAMKQRNKEGRFMNLCALAYGNDRDSALLHSAEKFFGSWSNALRKIGLDPEKIKHDAHRRGARKPGRHKSSEGI